MRIHTCVVFKWYWMMIYIGYVPQFFLRVNFIIVEACQCAMSNFESFHLCNVFSIM